ncbi:MAG: hypothetical protein A3D39_04605 [Candidatus Buchananbacteria bacterium RIFCSPHIGHO2_02_FULL_39_17]|nr:MAG: hypothetical protein A3D39_04605 [Candidatus Buchananbacteria bacterium RIFCSPHIGHO2_02_FULL_39_17]
MADQDREVKKVVDFFQSAVLKGYSILGKKFVLTVDDGQGGERTVEVVVKGARLTSDSKEFALIVLADGLHITFETDPRRAILGSEIVAVTEK